MISTISIMKKNYPLKKRPFIRERLVDERTRCVAATANDQPENLSTKPEDLRITGRFSIKTESPEPSPMSPSAHQQQPSTRTHTRTPPQVIRLRLQDQRVAIKQEERGTFTDEDAAAASEPLNLKASPNHHRSHEDLNNNTPDFESHYAALPYDHLALPHYARIAYPRFSAMSLQGSPLLARPDPLNYLTHPHQSHQNSYEPDTLEALHYDGPYLVSCPAPVTPPESESSVRASYRPHPYARNQYNNHHNLGGSSYGLRYGPNHSQSHQQLPAHLAAFDPNSLSPTWSQCSFNSLPVSSSRHSSTSPASAISAPEDLSQVPSFLAHSVASYQQENHQQHNQHHHHHNQQHHQHNHRNQSPPLANSRPSITSHHHHIHHPSAQNQQQRLEAAPTSAGRTLSEITSNIQSSTAKVAAVKRQSATTAAASTERRPSSLPTTGGSGGSHPPRYQCNDCGKSYSTFSGLSKHQQSHCPAANREKKTFCCKHCDKVYVSLGALKMHIRTHTLPCKCNICGKAFSRPWLLQGHIRTHTGEKPFHCEHCKRAFADRSNLRAHLQTHSDVKKYSCVSCSKTFSRMSLLTKHAVGGCSSVAGGGGSEAGGSNSSPPPSPPPLLPQMPESSAHYGHMAVPITA